jgi:transposase
MTQSEEIALLRKENTQLKADIAVLRKLLQEALDKLKKNSSNSSKPPSTDIVRKTVSLRTSSSKSLGGQKGHLGSTLEKSLEIDQIIVHAVECCSCCGEDLKNVNLDRITSHQVFDLPQIKLKVIEHQAEVKSCPNCAKENKAIFPTYASQPTQYGSNLKAFACYLSSYQFIPYQRCSKLIQDLTGHRISKASLVKFNASFSAQLAPFITALKEELILSPQVHFDETGYYYSNKRNWLHVACNEQMTYFFPHPKRGKEAMDDMGILNHYKGRAMHDFWVSYMDESFDCQHDLYNVHHLRDFTFCEENEKSTWAKEMKNHLLKMKKSVDESIVKGLQNVPKSEEQYLLLHYDTLLEKGKLEHPLPDKIPGKKGRTKKSKSRNMLERFENHKESIVGFLKDFQIPFSNNLAEQAVRMMKVQQKISGCFRSENGAEAFANARSYIDTIRKKEIDIIDAISLAINAKVIIPFA